MSTLLEQLNNDLANTVEDVRRSLVQINQGSGNGAGTIWHPDGLIITNAHVVSAQFRGHRRRGGYIPDGALTVTLPDGNTVPARILAQDEERDVAALSVDVTNLPVIRLGDSRKLQPGQWVFAIGHPWGVMGAASAGIVVGTGTDLPEVLTNRDWIVTSLRVRPGNSGGPLVDARGRLIGINTLMTGPQIGAAVPVHVIAEFLKEALGSPVAETLQPAPAL